MLRLGTEMVSLSTRAVDFAEYGPLTRLQVHLERGDWPHLDGELAAMGRRLRQAPRPFETLWWQVVSAARAQTRGDWCEAERLVGSSLTIASGPEYGTAFQLLLTQRVITAWNKGDDLLPLVGADVLPAGPMRTSWEATLLGWTSDRRGPADVEAELDRLLERGIASVREDLTFGPVTSALAMATADVKAERHAATLYDALSAFADQWAGTAGAVVNGPYALHLGRLAAVLGRCDEAEDLLDRAEQSALVGGCTAWLARVHLAQAELAGDPRVRRARAREAEREADALGMRTVGERARSLLGTIARPAGLTERECEVLRQVAAGCTNTEIANRLCLSVKTVERHLLNAYRKAGVRNRAEAAAFALRELTD
jgi:DNA-binding CsgD family transcriptional regulator